MKRNYSERKRTYCDECEGLSSGYCRCQGDLLFVDDIYNLTELLKSQSDLIVIRNVIISEIPKPNGYRSYHVIVGVPVYCLDGMEYFPVEIQFRTMSMDFWASMEHRISYKKERTDKEQLRDELREYANMLVEIESRFEQYNETDHQQEKRTVVV